jgi:Arc/MetJ-type ribon-helix-helix transcriptional regulator
MPAPPTRAALAVKLAESEKITVNLGFIDLGQVDLLVGESFYANRTDFIRTAIRNQLAKHSDEVRQLVAKKMLVLGLQRFTVESLESVRRAGETLDVRVLGLATIDPDVSAELALATIHSISVLGALHASTAVRQALASRIT